MNQILLTSGENFAERKAHISVYKPELDKILITDRHPGYTLLWSFTKTLPKRLRETNEKMAGYLAMSGGF